MADDEEHLLLHAERSSIFETRVERAALCRDRGSARFRLKDLAGAISWYERALFHVDFDEASWTFELLDKHRAAVNEVRLPVYLNLAACYLADGPQQSTEKVVENASLALAIDASNTKALYRAGRAHLMTGNLDAARASLTKAAQNQPNDKNIREALQTLRERLTEHKTKEKEAWGGRLLAEEGKTEEDASEPTPATPVTQSDAEKKEEEDDFDYVDSSRSAVTTSVVDDLRFWLFALMAVVSAVYVAVTQIAA